MNSTLYTPEEEKFTPSLPVTTARLQYCAQCLSLFLTHTPAHATAASFQLQECSKAAGAK